MNTDDFMGKSVTLEDLKKYHQDEAEYDRSLAQEVQNELLMQFKNVNSKAYKQRKELMNRCDRSANFHIKAVQALNDVCRPHAVATLLPSLLKPAVTAPAPTKTGLIDGRFLPKADDPRI